MDKIMKEAADAKPDAGEKIQEEIRHTESEISDTLHAIEQKLSPSRILKEMKRKLADRCADAYTKGIGLVKKRPVPAAVVGLATVAILVAVARRSKRKGRPEAQGRSTWGRGR